MIRYCAYCGWRLDDEHAYNVNCAVANAENDQLEAHVREVQRMPRSAAEIADDARMVDNGMAAIGDTIALANFRRLVAKPW